MPTRELQYFTQLLDITLEKVILFDLFVNIYCSKSIWRINIFNEKIVFIV